MGLSDRTRKNANLYFANDPKKIETEAMRDHLNETIAQEEKPVKKPTVGFAEGKMHVQRPKGTLQKLAKPIDMKSIKKSLQKPLQKKAPLKKIAGRVRTGVLGLDDVMEGGLRQKTVTLVGGGAGSGKSIFCMQFLMEGIAQGENGVYITFEQTPVELFLDMERFGWNLEKQVKDKKLIIILTAREIIIYFRKIT